MSGSTEFILPFERGKTYKDGSSLTLAATTADHLLGTVYKVIDTVHSTGKPMYLRIVRAAAAITSANAFYAFGTGALDLGRELSGTVAGAGVICKPLDDAYTVGTVIAQYDLCYVVEEGPCNVVTEVSSVSLSQGDAVASDGSGLVNGAACAAAEYPVGTIDQASTTAGATVVIHVNAGLAKPPAAG